MRCSEFEDCLQTVTDAQSRDFIGHREIRLHAAACRSCALRLEEEQLLTRSLSAIGAQARQISPSLEIEPRVMKAFDREQQNSKRQARNRRRYAGAAIAAAFLLMATAAVALLRQPKNSAPQASRSSNDLSAAIATVDVTQVQQPFKRRAAGVIRPKHSVAGQPASEPAAEIATDFIRLNDTASLDPGSPIVRIQLPRSAMSQFGLPVNMDRADQPVKADVVMGFDGVAQAIRFVQ